MRRRSAAPSITCLAAGKPLPRRGDADDGQAWLRDYLRREGVSADELLPTPLRLRKEIERLTGTVQDLRSEQEVREAVAGLNQRILQWRRLPGGPARYLPLVKRGNHGRQVARRAAQAVLPGARCRPDDIPAPPMVASPQPPQADPAIRLTVSQGAHRGRIKRELSGRPPC